MSHIRKRPYPWPGTSAISRRNFDQLISKANTSLSADGSLLQQNAGGSTMLSLRPEAALQFAMLMTQEEIDADLTLQGQGELYGFRTRQTVLSDDTAIDDDMLSAWCYIVTIRPGVNVRTKRIHEPVLVYFPMLSGAMLDEMAQECVSISYEESFAIVWNPADGRWESLRVRNIGDTMDVVMVCDSAKPVENCDGSGELEDKFCCLFDGTAFRLLPDCSGGQDGAYFCNPDSHQFDVWIYAPDKRALPPEGVCDWGRRVQDSYTVQSWKPWGADDIGLSETRPVYQVAACACNCPRDEFSITMWCALDPEHPVTSGYFPLRVTTGSSVPIYSASNTYVKSSIVRFRTGDTAPWRYFEAIQDVPINEPPLRKSGNNWNLNAVYWTEITFEDELTVYEGEFSVTCEVPMVVSQVTYTGQGDPGCGEDIDIGFVAWDPETGEPIKFWCDDGNADPDQGSIPANFDNEWEITGNQCILASEMGEAFDGVTQNAVFWYRIRLFCTLMTGDNFGFMNTVNHVQIYQIMPPGHYVYDGGGEPAMSSPDRLISGATTSTDIQSCMGRVLGKFEDSDLGSQGPPPHYELPPRYTPFLNYHRLMGCGYTDYDQNGDPTVWCMCDNGCQSPPVYFKINFNCNLANPI